MDTSHDARPVKLILRSIPNTRCAAEGPILSGTSVLQRYSTARNRSDGSLTQRMKHACHVQPNTTCRNTCTSGVTSIKPQRFAFEGARGGHRQKSSKPYTQSLTRRLSRKAVCSCLSACQSPALIPARWAASFPSRAVICSQSVPEVLPAVACSAVAVSSPLK